MYLQSYLTTENKNPPAKQSDCSVTVMLTMGRSSPASAELSLARKRASQTALPAVLGQCYHFGRLVPFALDLPLLVGPASLEGWRSPR